jgi:hypothetical protein
MTYWPRSLVVTSTYNVRSDRDVWAKAGAIVAEHGTLSADDIDTTLGFVADFPSSNRRNWQ